MDFRKGELNEAHRQILMQNLGAFAGIQGGLLSAAEHRDVRTILITSCNRGEGKTVAASGMAYTLAGPANADVLLMDGNLSAPALHTLFAVAPEPGLSDYLATDIALDEAVCPTSLPHLLLMPCGRAAASLFDLTRSDTLTKRLASLKSKFDYVICDGSSVFGSSDASLIAGFFDGVVLVVECERTRWEVVRDAKERLTKAGGRILGVALNKRRYYIPKALYAGG